MRAGLMAGLALTLAGGCAAPGTGGGPTDRSSPASVGSSHSPPSELRLDESVHGRVVGVNPTLRYVVMDFAVRRLPALDQRLNVYREGHKVGEVKATGPILGSNVAGDLLAGEAQTGDEVRED